LQEPIKVASEQQLERLHNASLHILKRTGIEVHLDEARDLLRSAGALVNGIRVRLPKEMVEQAIDSAPDCIMLHKQDGVPSMEVRGTNYFFGSGSDLRYTIDLETGERRLSTLKDVADSARLVDQLEHFDFHMSYGLASDVAMEDQEIAQLEAMLANTKKPLLLTQFSERKVLDRIYNAVTGVYAGGKDGMKKKPYVVLYGQFISPFLHHREGLERLFFCADNSIPLVYVPTILAGASSPVTMASALAVGNAECLAGLTIHQLRSPGAPFIYGGCITPFDMRIGNIAYGCPEWNISDTILAQLSRRYKIPLFATAGCTDAKIPDGQAVAEAMYSLLMDAAAGCNIIHDAGYMESGLCGSPEYLVMNNELIAVVKNLLKGYDFSDEALSLDLVDRVGPGGHFLEEEHTLKHFRKEVWYPELFHRGLYEQWKADGSSTFRDCAHRKALTLLKSDEHEGKLR